MADNRYTAQEEIWKPVVGFEDRYLVSSLGRVKALARRGVDTMGRTYEKPERLMVMQTVHRGYQIVGLTPERGISHPHKAHHLVLNAFSGLRGEAQECRHLNGDPSDNRLANLIWGSKQENADDKRAHGTMMDGRTHPLAKLDTAKVVSIREMWAAGESCSTIAKEFGISTTTALQAAHGQRWKFVPLNLTPRVAKRPTHCGRGHELTPDNVYVPLTKPNARMCRECLRINDRKAKAKRRANRTLAGAN